MMSELQKYKLKRSTLRRNVTLILKKIETNISSKEINYIELLESLAILKQKEVDLKDIDDKVEDLIDDLKELEAENVSSQEYRDKIILWKIRGESQINEQKQKEKKLRDENNDGKTFRSEQVAEGIKLPKLSLPIFSGNIIEWITFKDLFNASISKNASLSNAQKLQYLKASLKGDAYRIIQSISIADHNFEIAWNLLDERYSNKREQVFANIKRFLNIPSIQIESSSAILNLVDDVNEIIRSLEILEQKVEHFSDTLMMYLILQKLDNSTKLWWERQVKSNDIPKLTDLIEFLKHYARTLQNSKSTFRMVNKPVRPKINAFIATSICAYCKEDHYVSKCHKFLSLSVKQRIEFVKANYLCFNCLSNMHVLRKCKSVNTCNHCSKKHHSILHIVNDFKRKNEVKPLSPQAPVFTPKPKAENLTSYVSSNVCENFGDNAHDKEAKVNKKRSHTLLCTAKIRVKNASNEFVNCRCFLDTGSESSFIRSACVQKLGLNVRNSKVSISCLGMVSTLSEGEVDLVFTPHFNEKYRICTTAYVIENIAGKIPNAKLPLNLYEKFDDLMLADPNFHEPGEIDILLGVNVFFTLINGEIIKRDENLPFAIRSKLGWIISGNTAFENQSNNPVSVNCLRSDTEDLVKSFWDLEQIPSSQPMTKEEKLCEALFQETHIRKEDGRYSVQLPFKTNREKLGNSRVSAFYKFINLERRLLKTPEIYQKYKEFMSEYLSLGHMEKLSKNDLGKENEHYYIPHLPVMNESSPTTKLRVVFNASSKTTSGISLNDTLMNGPKVQEDLFTILMRFRCQNIAITGDLQKMYRQIEIQENDRNFHRILWRDDSSKPIESYRLCTVTYGTTSASYLATRVLKQLAIDEGSKFPKAADIVLHNFYVDDVLFGTSTPDEAVELISQLRQLLDKAGFQLHKWCTNDSSVLERSFKGKNAESFSYETSENKSIKVLGLRWEPTQDEFSINLVIHDNSAEHATKRTILSSVAKIFDPLGWLAPFVISEKILIQELWKLHLSWDEPVPEEISKKWNTYCKDISHLDLIRVPRKVLLPDAISVELHCFCDASEKAYAAVIYLRSSTPTSISVHLLASKTRVSPLRTLSIPRLELCAAVLLVHLLQAVRNSLQVEIDAVHAWTDSTIVLSWLQSEPTRWQTFVANRVSEIQSILPTSNWNHIRSRDNPADCASRGLYMSELVNHELWWTGPQWLKSKDIPLSGKLPMAQESLQEERKNILCSIGNATEELPIFNRISSFLKLTRIISWCIRFIRNCKLANKHQTAFLTCEELKYARNVIVRQVQKQEFPLEYKLLKEGKPLPTNSKILSLSPFMGEDELIRVGGRLRNAILSQDRKYPILLPKKHQLTEMIVNYFHASFLHAGSSLLLAIIRREYWIISARSVLRQQIWKCIKCHRLRAQTATQIMADFPPSRVIPSRVFSKIGMDFAGPFLIRLRPGRGIRSAKCYICIFVCFTTKAVHIEVVGNLTSESFIAALKRFVARRGKPTEAWSDCGTNFVAANKELKKIVSSLKQEESINQYLSNEGIKWNFNPPSAPHFGGLWEAAVKSAKLHLKRTIGEQILTHEEFTTLIAQIEACLNSRPLCPMPDDPSEFSVLTPGHFIIGTPLTALPETDLSEEKISTLHRWKLTQKLFQSFWKRWSHEYITNLQRRSKWLKVESNMKVNDLVIIKEDNVPPLKWRLGRVIEVFPSADDKIRVVNLKTATGTFKRPIHKLSLLPIND